MLRFVLVHQILWITGQLVMCAFGKDLGDFSIDSLDHALLFLRGHILHFSFDTSFHLLSILGLLTYSDPEASINQRLNVVL